MRKYPFFFLLFCWCLFFSGILPQKNEKPDKRPTAGFAQPPVAFQEGIIPDSISEQFSDIPEAVASTAPSFESETDIEVVGSAEAEPLPGSRPAGMPLLLASALALLATWVAATQTKRGMGHPRLLKRVFGRGRRHRVRNKRPRRGWRIFGGRRKDDEDEDKWYILRRMGAVLAVALVIALAIGLGLLICSILIGLPAAAFPSLALAMLCTLGVVAVLVLIGALIAEAATPHGGGRFQRQARGCAMALLIFLIIIPSALFLGGLICAFFINLILGVAISIGLGIAIWLIIAAFLIAGYFAAIFLGVTLAE